MRTFIKYSLLLIVITMGTTAALDIRDADRARQALHANQTPVEASDTFETGEVVDQIGSVEDETLRVVSTESSQSDPIATKSGLASEASVRSIAKERSEARQALLSTLAGLGDGSHVDSDGSLKTETNADAPMMAQGKRQTQAKVAKVNAAVQAEASKSLESGLDAGDLGSIGKLLGIEMAHGRDSVTVGRILPDGLAHRAGLRSGDTVVSVDRCSILDTSEFLEAVSLHQPGENCDVFVKRGDQWRAFRITIPEARR